MDSLTWAPDGKRSGWLHLYAVPVQGGAARALTVGKFEVTHFVFSQDRKRFKDRDCMKALLIPEARMIFVSLVTGGAPTYTIETLDAGPAMSGEFL